uniref:Glutathione peroxidase n=1 Tax=Rhizophora mucronata TaxID=61149 RepID=A0A2P2K3H5_RHIMU
MLCSSARVLCRKVLSFTSVSASLLLTKQLSFHSTQTLLSSLHNSPVSLVSQSIQSGYSRELLGSLRFDHTMASQSTVQSVYDFTVKDATGKDVDLSIYKGKVLLIVNVASQW